jgi:hypothetical protein
MSTTTTVSTKRSPILGWAIWLFAVTFCLAAIYELDRSLFWIEICVLLCTAIILFALTVPTRRRSRSFIIALVIVLSLWMGTLLDVVLTAVGFAESGFAQQAGLTAGSMPLVSTVLGLLVALLLVGAIVWLASVIAAEYILLFSPESGESRWKTECHLLRSTLGRDARYGIVENGEFKPTSPKSATAMATAPGTIMISPGHAAIFEKRGTLSKIEGPMRTVPVRIDPQEKCKHIVRLGPRSLSFACEGVLTKDGIPIVVRGTLVGGIEPANALSEREKSADPKASNDNSTLHEPGIRQASSNGDKLVSGTEPSGDATPPEGLPAQEPEQPAVKPQQAKSKSPANPIRGGYRKMSEWLNEKLNRLPKPHVESKPATGRSEAVADESEIVKDVTADYRMESIRRSIYSVPEQNLDQALKDKAMCVVREVIATQTLDQIIGSSRSAELDRSKPGTFTIADDVKTALHTPTANWGFALHEFRVDRIELPDTIQTGILEGWKQSIHGTDMPDRSAQGVLLNTLRGFREEQDEFVDLFKTFSMIVREVRRVMPSEGMKALNEALDGIRRSIWRHDEATRKLPGALKNLRF